MENASKALIMAGSILTALLVIGLLVFFYRNMQAWKKTGETSLQVEQATEFNKQYDVYARDIYGSELLSIVNKVNDYNKKESTNKGYTSINVELKVEKESIGNNENYFKKRNKNYNSIDINKIIERLKDDINNAATVKLPEGVTIKEIATMRTTDLKEKLGIDKEKYRDRIDTYNNLNNLLTTIKSTVFTYEEFEYDQYTGRITKMIFKY